MDKTTKIVIGVAGGIILLCICVVVGGMLLVGPSIERVAEGLIVEDPQEVQAMAEDMTAYTLPPGYQEGIAMKLFGFGQIIFFSADDGRPIIGLMEISETLAGSEEEMRVQLQDNLARQLNKNTSEMILKDEWTMTIRGQETTVYVYEGDDGLGNAVRQWVTMFDGNNDPVLVMIMGGAETWDETELTTFLESIR